MTKKEKWAKYEALHAEAERKHAEWRALCEQINALIMTRADDETQPKPRAKRR